MSMRRLPEGYSISGVAADEIADLIAIDLAASQLLLESVIEINAPIV